MKKIGANPRVIGTNNNQKLQSTKKKPPPQSEAYTKKVPISRSPIYLLRDFSF